MLGFKLINVNQRAPVDYLDIFTNMQYLAAVQEWVITFMNFYEITQTSWNFTTSLAA